MACAGLDKGEPKRGKKTRQKALFLGASTMGRLNGWAFASSGRFYKSLLNKVSRYGLASSQLKLITSEYSVNVQLQIYNVSSQ